MDIFNKCSQYIVMELLGIFLKKGLTSCLWLAITDLFPIPFNVNTRL